MSDRFDRFIGWQGASLETRKRLLETFCQSVKPKTVITNIGTVVLLAALMWHDFDHLPLIMWVLATSLIGIANRFYVMYLNDDPRRYDDPDRRAAELTVMSMVYGLSWGAGPLLFYADAEPVSKAVLVIVVMLASIMSTYAAIPGLQMARFVPAALMTVFAIGAHEGPAALIAAALIAFWLFLRGDITRSFHAALRRQLDLQDQLRDQQQQLERANAAKSDFLAVMSHEIRTPMNGILGMIDLINRTKPAGKLATYTRQLQAAGQHLSGLLNNILDFSRLEDRGIDVLAEPFVLDEMVDEVLEIIGPAAEQKGLEVLHQRGQGVPERPVGDAGLLRQVLINLLGNAVKFTETGRISLQISSPGQAGPGNHLTFRVTDTGRGIDPARLAAIFEPFVQEDASTTREHGGTGLGLTISRRIVEAMSGDIEIASAPDRGTEITVTVPIGVHTGDVAGIDAAPPDPAQLPPSRVLLVDDSEFNRMVIREILAGSPCRVDEAADGNDGLARFDAVAYDAVLSDIRMPGMDGYQFIRRIRSRPGGDEIPIIVLTAAAFREDRDRALAAGANLFMTKPFPLSALLRVLADQLSGRPAEAPEAATVQAGEARLAALLPRLQSRMNENLQSIDVALKNNDGDALSQTLHSARGHAGLFGLDELDEILSRMHADAQKGDLKSVGASVPIMRDILSRIAEDTQGSAGRELGVD